MSDEAFRPPGDCPVCGEFVPRKAVACAGCGASRDSGWNEEASVSGLDLPNDEEFDYDDFVAREFGQGASQETRSPTVLDCRRVGAHRGHGGFFISDFSVALKPGRAGPPRRGGRKIWKV